MDHDFNLYPPHDFAEVLTGGASPPPASAWPTSRRATEVALDAANEAFNASAGRLRKLYAIEKLSGHLGEQFFWG